MKTPSVHAHIDEDLTTQAEAAFARLGVPVSIAPAPTALEDMTTEQLNRKLEAAYQSAQNGHGRLASEAFRILEKELGF